ncbi:hypothetical protein N7540_011017 [Penicillium herquei]|nr:hypothetical protein N7540_011017 [Penicillium herquei]
MVTNASYNGANSGIQVAENYGPITANLSQPETLLDQACLRDLRTTNPYDDKERIKKTNGGLLKDSYRWILENEAFIKWQNTESNRLLWIRGDPGKGKTMLLCGIIEELIRLHGDTAAISFFFCQATDMRINSATSVLRGLIYSLVEKHPSLLRHVRARYDSAGKDLFEDINAWSALVSIFTQILQDPSLKSTYFVIDALDECRDGLQYLLDLIVENSTTHKGIKWVVSSRNEYEITECLDSATQIAPISLELNEASVSEAVNAFIQYKVDSLVKQKRYDEKTTAIVKRHLLINSQGTFLWVALVWKNLDQTPRRHVMKKLEMFPPGLDTLYRRMMGQVRDSEDAELWRNDGFDDLDTLLEVIGICGSFLTLRESTVTFVHQSAKDFLTREAFTELFPKGLDSEHYTIFSQCLKVLFKTLRRDMFDLKFPGISTKDISVPSPDPLASAEYACIYWADHLDACKDSATYRLSLKNKETLKTFLQQKYLYWLEALSILGSLSEGIRAMKRLERLIKEESALDGLLERAQDAGRFVQYHRTGIESSPLQVYYSPLIFSPSRSLTRIAFQDNRPDWVLNYPIVERSWSACLQTLEGHSHSVRSIAWSPDGRQLASGSDDNTVRIWDPTTGQSVSTFEGHSDPVQSIAWSPDGRQLASGSLDNTVRIWDPATGQSVSTLEGHSDWVLSIAWSPDGRRLASGSLDNTVRIWDPATGQSVSTLEGNSDWVNSIAWSPDGRQLASGSDDNTVRIWDPTTGQSVSTFEGHSDPVQSIAWSPDGRQLASGSEDNSVRIWDPATGQSVSTLEGHSDSVESIAWSPDGRRLASGSLDNTVRIWDLATGQSVSTLEGHSQWVWSIAWSPDGSRLASALSDNTVRIWDPATGQSMSTLKGHSNSVLSIAWSPDRSQLASGSSDKTVRIWDPPADKNVFTLEGHSGPVQSIAWSPDGCQLASGSRDNTVRVWDPATGQSVSTLEGHSNSVQSIVWSPDGSRLASRSSDNTVRIWDPATSQSMSTLKGHGYSILSIAWSPDGRRLASGSLDNTVRIWDPATGQSVSTLKAYGKWVPIAWSPDGRQLASESEDNTVCIWDPATGQSVYTLEGHSNSVRSIVWSPDGSRLASGSEDNTVRIWDPATGQSVSTLEGHSDWVLSIAWSPDGNRLASGSRDKTIQIWDSVTGQGVSTLSTGLTTFVEFDIADSNCLHTYTGIFRVSSVDAVTPVLNTFTHPPKQYGYGLSDDCSWVTYDGLKLLWLPPDYRPLYSSFDPSFARHKAKMAYACSANRVIFLELSNQRPIPSL